MRKTIGLALAAMTALVALLVLVWQSAAPSAPGRGAPAVAPLQATPNAPPVPSPPLESPAAYPVNLEELRRRLPENLYWTLGAPTDDQAVLRQRAERARQTNELYGKVLSTTASEEEIGRYYAERRRVSEDYIQFSELVLAEYRDRLPDEQIGLYELSIKLHRARLAEIPRDMNDALARRRAKNRR
jgi:hypothetical protein